MSSGPFLGLNNEGSDWDAPITRFDWKPEQRFFAIGNLEGPLNYLTAGNIRTFDEDEVAYENGKGLWLLHTVANVKSWRIQGSITDSGDTISFDYTVETGLWKTTTDDDSGISTVTTAGTIRPVREWQKSVNATAFLFSWNYERESPYKRFSADVFLQGAPEVLQTSADSTLSKPIWAQNFTGNLRSGESPQSRSEFGDDSTVATAQTDWTFLGREIHGYADPGHEVTLTVTAASYYDDTEWE